MDEFLAHQIDGASAMTYNELAQVLETKNPDTGKLYTLKDLKIFTMQGPGTGMLQDGLFVRGDWIKDKANQATATKFLTATFQGWIYCRNNWQGVRRTSSSRRARRFGSGHQRWQMNEVNELIWPAPATGIGVMVAKSTTRTPPISKKYGVIKKLAKGAYTPVYAKKAVAALKRAGVDVCGQEVQTGARRSPRKAASSKTTRRELRVGCGRPGALPHGGEMTCRH